MYTRSAPIPVPSSRSTTSTVPVTGPCTSTSGSLGLTHVTSPSEELTLTTTPTPSAAVLVDPKNVSGPSTFFCRFHDGTVMELSHRDIERIPYLHAAITNKSLQSTQNERKQHEYILPAVISYPLFVRVLDYVESNFQQPRHMLSHLPITQHAPGLLTLFQFLSLPVPTLTVSLDDFLDQWLDVYDTDDRRHARDLAVQLGFQLLQHQYDLSNEIILNQVYSCFKKIVSYRHVFGPHLRYHMLQIAQVTLHQHFTSTQMLQLQLSHDKSNQRHQYPSSRQCTQQPDEPDYSSPEIYDEGSWRDGIDDADIESGYYS